MKKAGPIILIADDDLDDLELLEEMLLHLNEHTTVHTVTSGREITQFITNCEPDYLPHLIVLDYNIPDMNGLDIFRVIQGYSYLRHVPVVFWSTSNATSLKAACEQAGAYTFVTKPTSVQDVQAFAQQLISICTY